MDYWIDEFYNINTVDSINIFYFSGHGKNDEIDDVLYPINGDDKENYLCLKNIIDKSKIVDSFNIFILDSCRNATDGVNEAISYDAHKNVFIAKATDIGNTAMAGLGKKSMSVFTSYIVEYIDNSNITIDTLFNKVRSDVLNSYAKQLPVVITTMSQDIMLCHTIKNEDEEILNELIQLMNLKNNTIDCFVEISNKYKISYLDLYNLHYRSTVGKIGTHNNRTTDSVKTEGYIYITENTFYKYLEDSHYYNDVKFNMGELQKMQFIQPKYGCEIKLKMNQKNLYYNRKTKKIDIDINILNMVNNLKFNIYLHSDKLNAPLGQLVTEGTKLKGIIDVLVDNFESCEYLEFVMPVLNVQDQLTENEKNILGDGARNLTSKQDIVILNEKTNQKYITFKIYMNEIVIC